MNPAPTVETESSSMWHVEIVNSKNLQSVSSLKKRLILVVLDPLTHAALVEGLTML